jgi:predicted aconitase
MPSQVKLALTTEEQAMLAGDHGPATAMCMRIIVGVANANGAEKLIEIESAHADGTLYHGEAGLDFTEKLVALGGKVIVRTTTNVGSLDLLHPDLVHGDKTLMEHGRRLMDAHIALGCEPTWSCAPYQAGHRPKFGSHVAWAESNAIAFVNSVLGARSDRYGDFLDLSAAVTGRVPFGGLHHDAARKAVLVLDFTQIDPKMFTEDAAWAALGVILGNRAGTRVAAMVGLPGDLNDGGVTEDRLKGMGATGASAGGVGLFHVVGITPEAPTLEAIVAPNAEHLIMTAEDVRQARDELSTTASDKLDAVSLGTPHFSIAEFRALAEVIGDGPKFSEQIDFYISTSRDVMSRAKELGYLDIFLAAGGRVLTDTCTYVTPVMSRNVKNVMTNSGKWAWYAPGNLGIDTVLGSLSECVASARAGRVIRDESLWS